jgi:undecaprenyl-diphosphatase
MDYFLFQQINGLAGKFVCLDSLAIYLAKYFEYVLVFCLFLFLLKNFKKYWPLLTKSLVAAVLARCGIVELIRWLWERPRPFVENQANLLLDKTNEAAFPSGHAAFFFALSFVVYRYNKKAGLGFFTASFLISIARVFCGVHWPTDIIGGAIVGIFSGWLVCKLFKKRG